MVESGSGNRMPTGKHGKEPLLLKSKIMKLIKTFEKYRKHQLQVIEVTCEVNTKEDIDDLSYEDYQVNLFINHKFIADISNVLDNAGLFTDLIDGIDWLDVYSDSQLKHAV